MGTDNTASATKFNELWLWDWLSNVCWKMKKKITKLYPGKSSQYLIEYGGPPWQLEISVFVLWYQLLAITKCSKLLVIFLPFPALLVLLTHENISSYFWKLKFFKLPSSIKSLKYVVWYVSLSFAIFGDYHYYHYKVAQVIGNFSPVSGNASAGADSWKVWAT